jgi:hypothetical protein
MIYYRIFHKDLILNKPIINSWGEKRTGFLKFIENKIGKIILLNNDNFLKLLVISAGGFWHSTPSKSYAII